MFKQKCPHCGVKLGNFLYADACPRCHEMLERNLPKLIPLREKIAKARSWPVQAFFSLMRFVES
jgi:hypothetical protein